MYEEFYNLVKEYIVFILNREEDVKAVREDLSLFFSDTFALNKLKTGVALKIVDGMRKATTEEERKELFDSLCALINETASSVLGIVNQYIKSWNTLEEDIRDKKKKLNKVYKDFARTKVLDKEHLNVLKKAVVLEIRGKNRVDLVEKITLQKEACDFMLGSASEKQE